MNKWIGCGRLVKDPDVKNGQTMVARYTLAIDRRTKEKETDFISCVTFGKSAEFAEKYLKKGMKILVVGRIQTGSYEKDGKKIYTTDVIVEEHEFVESKGESSKEEKSDGDFMEVGEQTSLPF